MLLGDSRAAFFLGLAVEVVLLAAGTVVAVMARDGRIFLMTALAAGLWGLLLASWVFFSVRVRVDASGIVGRDGINRVNVRWSDVESMGTALGHVTITRRSGSALNIPVHGLNLRAVLEHLDLLREQAPLAEAAREPEAPPQRYAIPAGVDSMLALEKSPTELLCVNVMLGGKSVESVAKAARVLAIRAADENRWDPTFTGKIQMLVSGIQTPASPKLRPLMDEAIAEARAELAAKGWAVVNGARLEVGWALLGPEGR